MKIYLRKYLDDEAGKCIVRNVEAIQRRRTQKNKNNMTTDTTFEQALSLARNLGIDAGTNAASWYEQDSWGGRCSSMKQSVETAKRFLSLYNDGDPALSDNIQLPSLSGEWAGDLSGPALFEKVTGRGLDGSDDQDDFNDICLAWEEGVQDSFWEYLVKSAEDITGANCEPESIALANFLGVNPTEIEESSFENYGLRVFSYGREEYAIGSDSDCDDAWDQALDSYIDYCILPEIKDQNLVAYFDTEKWKRDARYDGRGHSLSSYDGNEIELDGDLFAYRIN